MVGHSKDAQIATCSLLLGLGLAKKRKKQRKRNRRVWVRDWIQKRDRHGAFHALQKELQDEDAASHRNFLPMDEATFLELLDVVGPLIRKKDTVMREAISAEERLALTLRYLASGIFNIFR